MAYRFDADLEFLKNMESEDLNDLVEAIVGKEGDTRLTESLTTNDLYEAHYPDHKQYVKLIMGEIQEFGGNSFANVFRGGGVFYREIVRDVADRMKVKYKKGASTADIEIDIFVKIVSDAFSKMSEAEIQEVMADFAPDSSDLSDLVQAAGIKNIASLPKAAAATAMMQFLLTQGGFATYKATLIVANVVWKTLFGHGLALATNAALTRALSVLIGPIGWAIAGIWTALDIAGPAYRVTVPVVIQVAYLRSLYEQRKNGTIDKDGNEIVK